MANPSGPQDEIGQGQSRNLITRVIGLTLIISAAVLATYLVVAYFAWESGQRTRTTGQAQTAALLRQVELARTDAAQGSTTLALRRLDWVLEQDSGQTAAQDLRREILAMVDATAAAVPTAQPRPTTTAEPAATETVASADSLPELQEIRRLVAAEAWDQALPAILALQQANPEYERNETNELLYKTYLNLGLNTIDADELGIETGLNYLLRAEQLGTLPQEAEDYRYWSNLYLDGMGYYGVNWETAGYYFRDLCAAAPFFHNACLRLNEILTKQADQLAFAGDWCPAEAIYRELWQQDRSQALSQKLNDATANCAAATPVPISGTVELTGTVGLTETQPITNTEPGE